MVAVALGLPTLALGLAVHMKTSGCWYYAANRTPIGRAGDRARVAPRGTFRQIADQLRERIRDGSLPPGAMVPSEQALVEEHGVARGTVRSALALLVDDGLIEVVPGQGRRVAGRLAGQNPTTAYERIASDLARRVRSAEFGADGPLPSEAALIAEFGVSRSTVRRAYRLLVDEGLVVVRHGVGAFVAPS